MVDVVRGAPVDRLEVQEFRLYAEDTAGTVAGLVSGLAAGSEPAVPLLTSVDDPRDVATVRAQPERDEPAAATARRAALDPLVATWRPCRHYRTRIAERSSRVPSHYRLAVTESGINDAAPPAITPRASAASDPASAVDLLWIGSPVGSGAGLMILLGDDAPAVGSAEPNRWSVPLSRRLGVRIYEGPR